MSVLTCFLQAKVNEGETNDAMPMVQQMFDAVQEGLTENASLKEDRTNLQQELDRRVKLQDSLDISSKDYQDNKRCVEQFQLEISGNGLALKKNQEVLSQNVQDLANFGGALGMAILKTKSDRQEIVMAIGDFIKKAVRAVREPL